MDPGSATTGPVPPQLIVPVAIQMNPQPDDAMLVVVGLFARPATDQNASPHLAIHHPISQQLVDGFHWPKLRTLSRADRLQMPGLSVHLDLDAIVAP